MSTAPRNWEKASQRNVADRPAAPTTRVGRVPKPAPSAVPASAPIGRPSRISHIVAASTRA